MVKNKKDGLKKYGPWISLIIIIAIIVFLVNIDRVFNIELPTPEEIEQEITKVPLADISSYQNNPNGILIEEYSDYQCPFCRNAYPLLKQILLKHNGKINFVHHHMALPYHEYAQKAAEAAECARDQGRFLEFNDKMFYAASLEVEEIKRYALQMGLDMEQFNMCLDSGMKEEQILGELDDAIKKGVTGTPTFAVNGEFVFLDEVEAMIMAYEGVTN
ncbi:DsbA family protein [Candidatus Woesearchaeota archaeon]|nr:DsbA family protein [Candidatus Woesearchaeota archaeon]MBW3013836.1 DsbA family protein [Candidatus Woesearchaeota archaeon]